MFTRRGRRGDEVQRGGADGKTALQASRDEGGQRIDSLKSSGATQSSAAAFARLRDTTRARAFSTPGLPPATAHDPACMAHASLQHQLAKSPRALLPEELVAALVPKEGQKAQRLPDLPIFSPLKPNAGAFSISPASVRRKSSSHSFIEVTPTISGRTSTSLLDCSPKPLRRRSSSADERRRCAMETARVGRAFSSSALQHSASSSAKEEEDETDAFFHSHGFSSDSPSSRSVPLAYSPKEDVDDDLDGKIVDIWQHRASFTTDLKLRRKDMRPSEARDSGEASDSDMEGISDADASSGEDDTEEMQAGPSTFGEQMPGGYMSQAEEACETNVAAPQSPSVVRTMKRPPALQLDRRYKKAWTEPATVSLDAPPQLLDKPVRRLGGGSSSPAVEALRGQSAPASPTTSRLSRPLTSSPTTGRPQSARGRSSSQRYDESDTAVEMVIAIVGPKSVGKTTVVRRGLRKASVGRVLSQTQDGNQMTSYHATFQFAGVQRSAEILEIDSAIICTTREGIIWPEGMATPHGVLVCYDATNANALPELKRLLSAPVLLLPSVLTIARTDGLWRRGGLISVVLACKSSKDVKANSLSLHAAAEACNIFGVGVIQLDGGIEDEAKKMRQTFGWIIRRILAVHDATSPPPSRASTSMSFVSLGQMARPTMAQAVKRVSVEKAHRRSASAGSDSVVDVSSSPPPSSPENERPMLLPKRPASTSFAGMATLPERPGDLDLFFSNTEIIDKVLYAAVAGNDEPFIQNFLVIFRRFARPHEVLGALIDRFDGLSALFSSNPHLARYAQQRLCYVLARWLDLYPGDFLSPMTYEHLKTFLEGLILSQHLAHYGFELLPLLKANTIDVSPEGAWALPDGAEDSTATGPLCPSSPSAASSGPGSAHASTADSDGVVHVSRSVSVSSATAHSSHQAHLRPPKALSDAKDQTLLELSNATLDCPEDGLAVQITKFAWETFSKLRPRDLLRYVMSPTDDNGPRQDFSNPVARSIHFVNFLAAWTASLILVQSKQKPRVRLLEKFIGIAACLRELDNFDCCMGVLAGLNAQPVFRLEGTWEPLRDKPIYKRFRSLNKLMSSTRSFAAYRMALDNSKADRLPYLGAHLQDLVRICESKPDMRDGLVNWSKFSQLAEHANVVGNSVELAPNLPFIPEAEQLISRVPVLSDEALYSLSYSIMPRGQRKGILRKLFEAAISPSSTAASQASEWLHGVNA